MKVMSRIVFLAGVTFILVALPLARAELVYESETAAAEEAGNDRENLRQVIGSSQKAEVAQPAPVRPQAVQAQPQYAQVLQVGPAAIEPDAPAPAQEVQHLSKSELLRRARLREELKNEDVLQERLEELRLRDERRRTDQVLGVAAKEQAPVPTGAMAMQQEIVSPSLATQQQPVIQPVAAQSDQIMVSHAQATTSAEAEESFASKISVTPRAGIADLIGNNYFRTIPRFAAGVGLGVSVTEQLTFEVGYSYTEFGIGVASSNPYVWMIQSMTGAGYTNNFATYVYKQNIFDAGLKLHLLSGQSKFRPFLGGGAGYSRSFLNYDQAILSALNQMPGAQMLSADYETSAFLGYLQAGFDVALSKNVLIGSSFRYHNVVSAQENQSLNTAAFYYGYNPDPSKTLAGGSLARSNFYTITGAASFSF